MAATTNKLNYAVVPPRATSSRALRNEVVPSNGSSFTMGNTIIFDLPSNVPNTFFDTHSSYISLVVTNNGANNVSFNGAGFPASIRRIVIELGGQTLYSLDHYGELYAAMMDLDASKQFKANAGSVLFGSSTAASGATLTPGLSRKVCFPLLLTPLMSNKYFPSPMSRDRMRIRIELDTVAHGLIGVTTAVVDSLVAVTDAKMVQYNLELGGEVMAQVAASSGGAFKLACPSFQHHQSSIADGASSISPTLGFSMSSLNRILVLQQRQSSLFSSATVGTRSHAGLERFSISVGGVKYPQLDVKIGESGAEALAEALISERALTTFGHQSSIDTLGTSVGLFMAGEPSGAADATGGKFLLDIDLESQRVNSGEGAGLVAGINTIGSIVTAKMDYSAAITNAHVINFYGEHTILLMLDLNTLTFTIAV